MSYTGTIKRVYAKDSKHSILVDVEGFGDRWFDIWDKSYRGITTNDGTEPVYNVEEMEGVEIRFDAKKGKLRDPDGPEDGERWNSTITSMVRSDEEIPDVRALIDEESSVVDSKPSQIDSTPEPVTEPVTDKHGDLTRLTMDVLNAQGKLFTEVRLQLEDCMAKYEELAKRGEL